MFVCVQVHSTIAAARAKVQSYFAELFERLQRQEVAATAVVDAYVRERLATLKQQQEDLHTLLVQITTVCAQCEQTLLLVRIHLYCFFIFIIVRLAVNVNMMNC